MRHLSNRNQGFTVPELIIAMVISSIILIGIMVLLVGLTRNSVSTVKAVNQIRSTQTALNTVKQDLAYTRNYLVYPSLTDVDEAASPRTDHKWKHVGQDTDHRMLILSMAATTKPTQDDTRSVVYKQSGKCPIGKAPVFNNVIYYVKNGNLYRRVLAATSDVGDPWCVGQTVSQQTTCTTPGTPPACTSKDTIIMSNVSSFNVDYYTYPADTTPITTSSIYNTAPDNPPSDMPSLVMQGYLDTAATIKITISSTATVDGKIKTYTSSMRAMRTFF